MTQAIRDVMTSNPCTIDADKSVAYAAKMMREEDVGLAPVVEAERLVGMLTDRDITIRVVADGKDPEQVKVGDVASSQLVTVSPEQDLDEALRMMAKHQVRRLPVVEEDGKLVGVVAQADIARAVQSARTALDSKAWGGILPAERGRIMFRMAQAIRDRAEELATLESRDTQVYALSEQARLLGCRAGLRLTSAILARRG